MHGAFSLSLIALIAGALLPAAFAPWHLWPLALICPAGLLWCLQHAGSRWQAVFLGWLFGFGFWLFGIYWVYFSIHTYGGAPAVGAGLLTLGFAAALGGVQGLLALAFWHLKTGRVSLDCYLLFPSCWLVSEWFRGWFLTGLPWLNLGISAVDWWAAGWLPVLGTAGLGALFAALSGALVSLVDGSLRRRLAVAGALSGLALSGWLLDQVDWVRQKGSLSARIVQTNLDAYERWSEGGLEKSLKANWALTAEGARLVLWPETSLPMKDDMAGAEDLFAFMDKRFAARGQTLALGLLHVDDGDVYNAIRLLGRDQGLYLKSHLVPFGEFTPKILLPLRQLFQFPASDMRPGPEEPGRLGVGDVEMAIAICYEIAYTHLVLPRAAAAGLIVTTSNDSWFGRSSGPWQHLQIARARSAETRRWTLRSTNGGIGGVIDDRGNMRQVLKPFGAEGITARVPVLEGTTPASKLPSLLFALLAALAMLWCGYRRYGR